MAINPRTYNEAKRLFNCMSLKKYFDRMTDAVVEELYCFLSENEGTSIRVFPHHFVLIDANHNPVRTIKYKGAPKGFNFKFITLTCNDFFI
ncbi:MAG: hypothetical protein IJO61_08070, partial [Oscillospiraceae bacterium]|nr:hypothetical protein [Oscillospiraceae bacterium]